jgi:hypothetical protein
MELTLCHLWLSSCLFRIYRASLHPLFYCPLQGPGDCLTHPGRKWHQRHPVETHRKAVTLSDPLLRMDDDRRCPGLGPNQAANPMLVAVECKPTPLVPEAGHIPEHEVAVQLVEVISGIEES